MDGVVDGEVAPASCDDWFGRVSPNGPVMKVEARAPSALTVAKMSP